MVTIDNIYDNYKHKVIDGKSIATKILDDIKNLVSKQLRPPSLAVIIIGNDNASRIYVNNKIQACDYVGIKSTLYNLPNDVTQGIVINLIHMLNARSDIDAILVQLPLPIHIDAFSVLDAIAIKKDVDGFTRYNAGSIMIGHEKYVPCTALGILRLLDSINFNIEGKNCVVIGSSNIVGKPLALSLVNRNATVILCNKHTKNIKSLSQLGDVLISATGVMNLIDESWVKEDAVVIDVGINKDHNNKVRGDIKIDLQLLEKIQYITPVPGCVGPMTVAMLMQNTLSCYQGSLIAT